MWYSLNKFQAVYSGVSVYEMETHGVAIMRRRHDSWLNATQILKVAGIDKGKRTKVLEKEILSGKHEKVQGGYGKYQGTWIDYDRGVEFCRQYGVEELLRPLLQYDMGQDGMTMAGQGNVDTPTKEQAMAAQRKRNMLSGGIDNRPSGNSPNGTFFKSISKTAANAVNAINKARFDSPGPRPGTGNKYAGPARRPSQQMFGSQESGFAGSSQQSMQSMHSENSFSTSQLDPALRAPYYPNPQDQNPAGDFQEPARKRARPSSSQDPFGNDLDITMVDGTADSTDAFYHQHSQCGVNTAFAGLAPLPQPVSKMAVDKQQLLTSLFLDPSQLDYSVHPALLRLSGEDLDLPIDGTAHTALHWAATLARPALVRALIRKGANIFRLNGGGETALIRASQTTNNRDNNTFPELLELLGPTIEVRDGRGRTVLHHIAVSSAVQGRAAACRYYLDCLLEFMIREGSAANSTQNSFSNGLFQKPQDHDTAPMKSMTLARFMNEIVNSPDMSGDTALNLAARIDNKSIIHQLLEIGADPTIPNRGGLKPVDFGVGGEPEPYNERQHLSQTTRNDGTQTNKVNESSQDLMSCEYLPRCLYKASMLTSNLNQAITDLITSTDLSFKSELTKKQSLIDAALSKLRDNTSQLGIERRRLSTLQQKADARTALRTQIDNLRRTNEEQQRRTQQQGLPVESLQSDVKVGEADLGLLIDTAALPVRNTSASSMSSNHINTLSALPLPQVLAARLKAYGNTNARLESHAKELQSRSSELEGKMKRVVGLCTGVKDESKVEGMLEGLQAAVESERDEDIEVGRVREFLRRVEGGAGSE